MSRIIYCNGRYVPYGEAMIHAEDRGFQFGDAIYEVCEVIDGRLVDETRHMDRLERSLNELKMPQPMSRASWSRVLRETIRRNRLNYGFVYLQVSRGVAPRDFLFPVAGTPNSVVVIARSANRDVIDERATKGIAVKTVPDNRWERCDIKTVMLLPASLAKEAARAEGAKEAWFIDAEGRITEGASSNAWIVDKDGTLVTRPITNEILKGVTRTTLIDVLAKEGVTFEERAFTVAEAQKAREAFITSAGNVVMPVTSIDGVSIGNGAPGLLSVKLRAAFHKIAEHAAA
jgi:D-alanine transaminase